MVKGVMGKQNSCMTSIAIGVHEIHVCMCVHVGVYTCTHIH